jgi:hypothetical protein
VRDRLCFRSFGELGALARNPFLAVRLLPFAPRVLMGESYSAFQPTQKRPQTFSSNNYSLSPYTLTPNGAQSLANDDYG